MKGTISIKKYVIILVTVIILAVVAVGTVYMYTQKSEPTYIQGNKDVDSHNSSNNIAHRENLDNIVFLGDSITEGYVDYDKVSVSNVIHLRGLAGCNMFNQKMKYMGYDVDLEEKLDDLQPQYLYVGFGMNDLNNTVNYFYDTYKQNIEKIRQICPDTKIVLVSITPINSDISTNYNVDNFNLAIKRIANEIGEPSCFYLNIHDEFSDDDGKLKEEFDSGDGIHISTDAYDVILDFIINNPVD